MSTPQFPRPSWRTLRKQSTLRDMKTLLTGRITREYDMDELAYRVLEGPIWTFTTIVDFLCDILKEKGRPMTIPELRTEAFREHYDMAVFERGMSTLDMIANIGRVWNKEKRIVEYRWYEPREGDELMQQAIDAW